jgi:hypothetical protein
VRTCNSELTTLGRVAGVEFKFLMMFYDGFSNDELCDDSIFNDLQRGYGLIDRV